MKCMSSCLSCFCGTKNSARVTPSDPLQVVPASTAKHFSRYKRSNGEGDGDGGESGRINPNFTVGDGEGDPNKGERHPVKALFIEVGKDRLLRVIHVKNGESGNEEEEEDEESLVKKEATDGASDNLKSRSSSTGPTNSSGKKCTEDAAAAGAEDDEEEYWFLKWSRKPRFRNIFAKHPETRPKLGSAERNNNSAPPEENQITVEMEMARAAAAAKRRAWAYNNNGNCESTITQQPTVTPGEEEFNSIAIVNCVRQQQQGMNESKGIKGGGDDRSAGGDASEVSPTQVQVEVSVEKRNDPEASLSAEGISNPAFLDDDDDDAQNGEAEYGQGDNEKTEHSQVEVNALKLKTSVSNSDSSSANGDGRKTSSSTASVKSRCSSWEEEDAITTEEPSTSPQQSNSPQHSSKTATPTPSSLPGDAGMNAAPKKPILFFIHSVAGSSDVWHHQFEYFQQLGYEIVAPDLLGHGLSSTPLNPKYYYFESLVQDLILIFDHFCTDEDVRVVLIGHGYGACLAAMLTRVRLKNVALLITIAGGGPTPLVRRTCCQDSWLSWKCKLFHNNRIRGRFDNPELKHVLPATIHEHILSGQVWPDGDSAFYRRITVPTLLTYGMRDKVVTLVEECEMERTIPKSFLELIDSAGHMVMLDEPERLNKMLCKFIQSWS